MRSSRANSFIRVTDCVAITTWLRVDACRSMPANCTMANGCSPSSGSARTPKAGSAGGMRSAAKHTNRRVPSDI